MTNERLEMILEWSFGFTLLLLYVFLSYEVAIRQVTEANSFGLPIILNSLTGIGGAWSGMIMARSKARKANGEKKE